MNKLFPYFFALFVCAPLWAEPKIGGDIPPRIPEEIQHAPVPVDPAETQHPVTPPSPWDSFLGRFRMSVEQSPAKECRHLFVEYYWDSGPDTTVKVLERAPFLLYFTPLELFSVFGKDKSEDPSTAREFYSFQVGLGLRGSSSVALEHQVLLPVVRSGRSQCSFGGYASTYFFRNGNPYWSTGLMGYAGYLVSSKVMLRAGMKHNMFDYIRNKEEKSQDYDWDTYSIKPNAWRMFVSLSIGSI